MGMNDCVAIGLLSVGFALYFGLKAIARAIERHKNVNIMNRGNIYCVEKEKEDKQ